MAGLQILVIQLLVSKFVFALLVNAGSAVGGKGAPFVCPLYTYNFGNSYLYTGNLQAEVPATMLPYPYGESYCFPNRPKERTRFSDGRLTIYFISFFTSSDDLNLLVLLTSCALLLNRIAIIWTFSSSWIHYKNGNVVGCGSNIMQAEQGTSSYSKSHQRAALRSCSHCSQEGALTTSSAVWLTTTLLIKPIMRCWTPLSLNIKKGGRMTTFSSSISILQLSKSQRIRKCTVRKSDAFVCTWWHYEQMIPTQTFTIIFLY